MGFDITNIATDLASLGTLLVAPEADVAALVASKGLPLIAKYAPLALAYVAGTGILNKTIKGFTKRKSRRRYARRR
jgi:hypothetical protein